MNSRDTQGRACLDKAAALNDLNVIKALLEHGAVLGNSLHSAVRANAHEAVRMLLEVAQTTNDVDTRDSEGETPLMASAKVGATDVHVLRSLCEGGANIDLLTADGTTAACIAAESGRLNALEVMIEFGGSMTLGTPPPMEIAVANRNFDLINTLVETGGFETSAALLVAVVADTSEMVFELGKRATYDDLERAAGVAREMGHQLVGTVISTLQGQLSTEL